MIRCVTLVRTDFSEERITSIIRVTKIGARNNVNSNWQLKHASRYALVANGFPRSPILAILMMEEVRSSETSVLTRASQRNIPEDGILHSHHCENLKSYIALTGWTL
jgi:hypothetical protein